MLARFKFVFITVFLAVIFVFNFIPVQAWAEPLPAIKLTIQPTDEPQKMADTVKLLLLLSFLSFIPAFLMMFTCFVRIIVVLAFLRHGLGTPQTPPTQILIGLALFLTIFIMAPVYNEINTTALQPFLNEEIDQQQAFELAAKPIRDFMAAQTREKDLALFLELAEMEKPYSIDDVPLTVLTPAFIISELKTAFLIGFLIFVPFLVIDMVVASTLMSMGMFMLPPIMISLPFKILLFVMVDGWYLVVKSLMQSFG